MRILGEDGGAAKRGLACALPFGGRLGLDLPDQLSDALPPLLRREILPAGQGLERQGLRRRKLLGVQPLAPTAGSVLPLPVEPDTFQRLAGEERLDGMGSRPLRETLHEVLFDRVRENVLQPPDLGPLLAADHDPIVSPPEDLLLPAVKPAYLPGQLRL